MRILYGIAAGIIWTSLFAVVMETYNLEISGDMQWLSIAIVIAGAMAGGD